MTAETLQRVEDLYRPYKEKKMSKASIAKAKGLSPLADILRQCLLSKEDFDTQADNFINDTGDTKTSVKTRAEAIQWAKDIIAEEVSDHAELRDDIRQHENSRVTLNTKPTKTFDANGVYKIYANYSKKLAEMPSYAYLAVAVELKMRNNYRYHYSDQRQTSQYLHTNTFVPKQHNTTIEYLIHKLSKMA
jgi:uncharacterized protein